MKTIISELRKEFTVLETFEFDINPDLRGIKIKQKTGKFKSIEGANIYAVIKSCISTYKKNGINLYEALKSIFTDNPILV